MHSPRECPHTPPLPSATDVAHHSRLGFTSMDATVITICIQVRHELEPCHYTLLHRPPALAHTLRSHLQKLLP